MEEPNSQKKRRKGQAQCRFYESFMHIKGLFERTSLQLQLLREALPNVFIKKPFLSKK